jgi:hypothetical protein
MKYDFLKKTAIFMALFVMTLSPAGCGKKSVVEKNEAAKKAVRDIAKLEGRDFSSGEVKPVEPAGPQLPTLPQDAILPKPPDEPKPFPASPEMEVFTGIPSPPPEGVIPAPVATGVPAEVEVIRPELQATVAAAVEEVAPKPETGAVVITPEAGAAAAIASTREESSQEALPVAVSAEYTPVSTVSEEIDPAVAAAAEKTTSSKATAQVKEKGKPKTK